MRTRKYSPSTTNKQAMRLFLARKRLGMTQKGLAFKAGINQSYIGNLENGKRRWEGVGRDILAKLLYALEVSKQDIEGEESFLDSVSPDAVIEFAEGVMPRKMIVVGSERYYLLRSFLYRFKIERKMWEKLQDADPAVFGVKEIDGHDYIRLSFMNDLLSGYLRMVRLQKRKFLERDLLKEPDV